MKILLVNPPANIIESRSEIKFASQPLGIAYIASVLEKNGFDVEILDTLTGTGYKNETKSRPGFIRYGLSPEDIKKSIVKSSPDVVGISGIHSNRIFEIHEVTSIVKEISKDITTIIGGGLASLHSEECLSDNNCDYIIMGEGEYSSLELFKKLSQKEDLTDIDGFGYKKNGRLIFNQKTKFIKNLDELPFPAYHLLDMEEYFKIDMRGSRYGKKRYSLFCGSRGCPYSCDYCAKKLIVGPGYRKRSIQNMIDEIKILKKNYDLEEIRFVDYHSMADIKHWKEFCKEMIYQKVNVNFNDPHGLAVNSLNDEILELMKKAGCNHLYISIESSDESFLGSLSKDVDLKKVDRIIKKARELEYKITAYFIIGLPGQKWKSIIETVKYAKTIDIDDVDFFIFNPFPGTETFQNCQNTGLFRDGFDISRLKYSLNNIRGPDYTPEMIEELRRKAWFEVMFKNKMKVRVK